MYKRQAQYGSLDGVIENAGTIKGTAGDNLRKSLDWLPQARKLITIRTDCDLSGQFKSINETLVKKPEDIAGLRKAYERYGFKSWLRELNATSQEKNDDKNQFGLFNEPAFQQGEFVGKQKYETVLTENSLITGFVKSIGPN